MTQDSPDITALPNNRRLDTNRVWKTALLSLFFTIAVIWLVSSRLGLRTRQNLVYEHVLVISVRSPIDNVFRLYVNAEDSPDQWLPSGEVYKPATLPGQEQVLRFNLPDRPVERLRLYLGNQAGVTEIVRLALVTGSGNTCTWNAHDLAQTFSADGDVSDLAAEPAQIRVTTAGPNAYLVASSFTLEQECERIHASTIASRLRWLLAGLILFGALCGGYVWLQRRGASLSDLALVTGFVFLLAMPAVGSISGLGNSLLSAENRPLATLPGFPASIRELPSYPAKLSAYFGDHFGWRNELIFLGNLIKVYGLNTSPAPAVVIGEQGKLYYTGDDQMLDYQGIADFDKERRKALYTQLEEINSRLQAEGIEFLIVIAPIKQTVYPEYLPGNIQKIEPETRVDKLLRLNAERANIPVLDLRPALIAKKAEHPLYYDTDTHWNAFGGFVAYQEIVRRLAGSFPGLTPHELSDYQVNSTAIPGRDLARLMMMHRFFGDTEYYLGPRYIPRAVEASITAPTAGIEPAFAREVDDPSLPTMVMFHDSYAFTFIPWLSEHFERSVYVWSYDIDWDLIAHEQPDIVILQFMEGRIEYLDQ